MKKLLFVTIAVLSCTFSFAQRTGFVNGAGNFGCGEFLSDKASNRGMYDYAQWVSGFASAYNLFSTHPQINQPDHLTVVAFLEKYCRDNPLHQVNRAAFKMIGDLGGWKSPGLYENK